MSLSALRWSSTIEANRPNFVFQLPHLYPKQKAAFFNDHRFAVTEASTKSGKTVGCMAWLISRAIEKGRPGRNFWWIAPTYQVAFIAFSRIMRMLARVDPHQDSWKANRSNPSIELCNGAVLWFKGADKPDSLYGEDVYDGVVDEASRCKEDAWHAIYSTLTATGGGCRIIGNVKGRKNWAYRLARMAESGQDPQVAYAKITALDAVEAGVLDSSVVDAARRQLPDAVFRELYLAEPADDGGNPFGIDAIRRCIGRKSGQPIVCYGVDLAKSCDWTWVIGLDQDGAVAFSERWQGPWGQTLSRLKTIIDNTPALIDSTGVGDPIVEELQRELPSVEGVKFTSQSKQRLMEGLAVVIQSGDIEFADERLINELEAFEYEYTRTGVRYTAPEGLHDDGVCALALAVECQRTIGGRQTHIAVATITGDDEGWAGDDEGWSTTDAW